MSTVQRVNYEPVSDILANQRRDFPLADPSLSDPNGTVPLIDGEWMILDANSAIARATDVGAADGVVPAVAQTSYLLFAERGRYDVQSLATKKMPILWIGDFEGDTRIFSAAQVAASGGAAITLVGQPLQVATITIGSRKFTGLVGHDGGSTNAIVGRVTRLPGNNNNKLRFRSAAGI